MVTFSGLVRTLAVAKNPATAILLKVSRTRAEITFKNWNKLHLTWPQFTFFRDNYEIMRRYQLENIDSASFRVRTKKFEFVGSPIIMCVINELESGNYDCDCQGKVVLDVGGFQGESAVFFSGMGANKVIIYEPVTANYQFIKENVRLNHVNAEIHDEGVGDKNGVIVVPYGEANNPYSSMLSSLCFGISQKGPYKMEIKVRNVADVIDKSGADLAKFDCEGAEKYLVNVPTKILRKIELYIIEVHSSEIKNQLIRKFLNSGFKLVKGNEEAEEVSTVHFKRYSL